MKDNITHILFSYPISPYFLCTLNQILKENEAGNAVFAYNNAPKHPDK